MRLLSFPNFHESGYRTKLRAELLRPLARGELVLPPGTTEAALRNLLNKLGRTVWNVKILERYDHGQGVATYLARYIKGGPISNGRLISLRDGQVTFRYRKGTTSNAIYDALNVVRRFACAAKPTTALAALGRALRNNDEWTFATIFDPSCDSSKRNMA